jgi:hypothetical protein
VTGTPEFMADADCMGAHADLWFIEGRGGSRPAEQTREAKAVCADCPAREECRYYAIANRELFGIWGGLTVGERRRYARAHPVRERACKQCNTVFTPAPRPGTPTTTCSDECARAWRLASQYESRRRRAS